MSFGVIVNTRTALPARGPTTRQDTLFLATPIAVGGPTNVATLVRSMDDFEAWFGPRTGLTVGGWDYLDVAFREGLKRAYVGPYSGGTYTDAFDLFLPKYGPGQLAVVGTAPSDTLYADMKTHCDYAVGPSINNRVALRDVNLGDTVAEMEALGDAAVANDETGATFGPWVTVPGPAGVYGAGPRSVPYSAAIAGLIARADADGNPNRAAAGLDYPFQYVTGFDRSITDVERAGLFAHGVNASSDIEGVLQNYGFQTNVAESPDNPFWQFNCSRARMFLKARSQARGQRYMFKSIDGRGKLAGALKSDIMDEFKSVYAVDGLFGATPQDAYYVEVGEVVNTIGEIAQGHLHAVAAARFSLHTKLVQIDLVSVPITGNVNG